MVTTVTHLCWTKYKLYTCNLAQELTSEILWVGLIAWKTKLTHLYNLWQFTGILCCLLEPLPCLLLVPQLHVALAKVQPVGNIETWVN